jgi:hypothetical protein
MGVHPQVVIGHLAWPLCFGIGSAKLDAPGTFGDMPDYQGIEV